MGLGFIFALKPIKRALGMAAQKRKRRTEQNSDTQDLSPQPEEIAQTVRHQRFSAWDYLFVNLFFWVFCWLQCIVAAYLNKDDMGLRFFFYTVAVGFTVVSIVTFIHDLFSGEIAKESEL